MSEEEAQEEKSEQEEQEGKSDFQEQEEAAEKEVADLEDDPPQDLEDWPDGAAKYKTFGGADSESGYDDGPTAKLGPSNVRHHEDGSITVDGEEVDNPDDYKGDPIPGGPTDPDSAPMPGDKSMGEGVMDDKDDDDGDSEGKGDNDNSADDDEGDNGDD